MNQTTLAFALTIFVLLLMAGTFAFFYLRSIRQELATEWDLILDKLRFRMDKIPNLVEMVRPVAPEQTSLLQKIVSLRSELWPSRETVSQRVQQDLELTSKLHQVWDLAKKHPELGHDVNFLSLQTEFKEIGNDIDSALDWYNSMVRKYNKKIGSPLFLPFNLLFRFSKLMLFEFEP